MTPHELLAILDQHDVHLEAVDGRLRVDAPRGVLDSELRARPSEHKQELLEIVNGRMPQSSTLSLLAWASSLANQKITLPEPVSFVEAPLRPITTAEVSRYASDRLRTIAFARLQQSTRGWGVWTAHWWRQIEQEAINALSALKEAIDGGKAYD